MKVFPIGQTISGVRWITSEEATEEGWYGTEDVPVLILSDGSTIYPSCDWEGNRGGALFGRSRDGDPFYITPLEGFKES